MMELKKVFNPDTVKAAIMVIGALGWGVAAHQYDVKTKAEEQLKACQENNCPVCPTMECPKHVEIPCSDRTWR